MKETDSPGEMLFWDLAEEMYADPAVARSTMMGFPCLRVNGAFFASLEPSTDHLIVKLSEARVGDVIDRGIGRSFAPNGRVFREWVAVQQPDHDTWNSLLREAKEFVGG